jgi:hypothetical protein
MSFDPVPVIMDALKAQFPGVKVFGGAIPKDENGTPLMLVRTIVRRPATAPTTQWWLHTLSVDVHSTDPAESVQLAFDAELTVNAIVGGQSGGSVAYCEVASVENIEDGAWTPTRYRNVLTVELTARNL